MLDCLAEVGSPALKVIFDTGNPVAYGLDGWTYYRTVREHVRNGTTSGTGRRAGNGRPGRGGGARTVAGPPAGSSRQPRPRAVILHGPWGSATSIGSASRRS